MTITFIPTIVCIVGPSGSGKTTVARFMEKALDIPMLVSYTTRPMRDGEIDGIDHYFVTEGQMPLQTEMLAYTNFAGHHYWVSKEDIPYTGAGMCSYVIDEAGLIMLKEKFSDEFIIRSLFIERDIESLISQVGAERVQRDNERLSLPRESYDIIVENNGRIEDFLAECFKFYKQLI